MGIVCAVVLILSVLYGCFTGAAESLSAAFFDGVKDAVEFCLKTGAMLCFFCGLMRIAADCGWTKALSCWMQPVLSRLIPLQKKDPVLAQDLAMNVSSNLLGLGNAATPFGIVAMKEMQKENKTPEIANKSMAMFVVLNTASIQLIPTTIAAMRASAGSKQPFDIIVAIWIVSFLSLFVGIITAKCFEAPVERRRLHSNRGGKNGNNR